MGDVENFDWQYEQHAALITPDGDVMCFDNGQYRAKNKDNYIKNRDNFSRGVRYRIDTEKMEIEQVWQYGKERGQKFFSPLYLQCGVLCRQALHDPFRRHRVQARLGR